MKSKEIKKVDGLDEVDETNKQSSNSEEEKSSSPEDIEEELIVDVWWDAPGGWWTDGPNEGWWEGPTKTPFEKLGKKQIEELINILNAQKKDTGKKLMNGVSDKIWKKIRKPVYISIGATTIAIGVFLGIKDKDTTHVKSKNSTFGELLPAKDRTSDILLWDKVFSYTDTISIKWEKWFTLFGKKIIKDIFGPLDDSENIALIEKFVEFGYKFEELENLPVHVTDSTLENGEKRRLIEFDNITAPDTLKTIFTEQTRVQNNDEWYNLSALQDDEFIAKVIKENKWAEGKEKIFNLFLNDMARNGEEYRTLAAQKFWQMFVTWVNMIEGPNAPKKTMLKLTFLMNRKKYVTTTTDGITFTTTIETSFEQDTDSSKTTNIIE